GTRSDARCAAAGAVHRQRRDDRERGQVRRTVQLSGVPRARRVRQRRAAPRRRMRSLVLYGREECCLCDEARTVVLRVLSRHPGAFDLQERDIEADEAILRMYLERIPVVTIDGVEAFELFVDELELERQLGIVRAE